MISGKVPGVLSLRSPRALSGVVLGTDLGCGNIDLCLCFKVFVAKRVFSLFGLFSILVCNVVIVEVNMLILHRF